MFFIRQGATHKVVIGPAVAVGDGFTPVTTLAVSSADEAEAILHDNGTVVDISGYTFAAITTADGYYHLTLQSGISNTVGHMTVVINDDSLILPLRADFTVLEESIYDAMYASGATGALPATLVQGGVNTTSGTITTLDGLDTAQDTQHATTQTAVGGIASTGGAALPVEATSDNAAGAIIGGVTAIGTPTGTYTNTQADDALYHVITGNATSLDWVYGFVLGGGYVGSSISFKGYLSGSNDSVAIQAWNGSTWDTRLTLSGQNSSTDVVETITLLARHTTTAAGLAYVRFVTTGSTNPVLNINELNVLKVNTSRTVGYAGGAVWIDTTSGVAGTEDFVNGVADNPVDTIADALTLASSVNLRKFWVGNGSTITLAATLTNKVMEGHEWTLALGGQNVASSMFIDAAVSGTATGLDSEYQDCIFAITSLPPMQAYNCSFTGTTSGGFTLSTAGDYRFINCQSGVAGSGSPLLTKTAGQAITAEFRRWSGGITVTGLESGDVLTIGGELGTVTLNGADGEVQIRGTYKAIVDNRTGSPTLNLDGAIKGADVALILGDTDELQGNQANWATATGFATPTNITSASGITLAASEDVYHALIEYSFDDPEDEYTVTWFKNGQRVTSGITSPTIQVVKRTDGTDLVASAAMTQIGSTGSYKYDESTNVISADESYLTIVSATIDSGGRSFACLVSRSV
jgi:hypothetical protein